MFQACGMFRTVEVHVIAQTVLMEEGQSGVS